jgi:hypothetical protein
VAPLRAPLEVLSKWTALPRTPRQEAGTVAHLQLSRRERSETGQLDRVSARLRTDITAGSEQMQHLLPAS